MWICLNNAFFSIVASERDERVLVVRARRAGDTERHFIGVDVVALPNTDYAYRAFIPRGDVAAVVSNLAETTAYRNFKSSVADNRLHDAYLAFWLIMGKLQRRLTPPHSE